VERYPFPAYANGWYRVAYSDDVAPAEVKPLHYFGRELVVFRGESGSPGVMDAHCSHLGAHLGHGGCVVEDTIRCPFHHWRWDRDGACVEIPYAKRIPPTAKMRTWPVAEKNGLILMWYDAEGRAPGYEIPDVPEVESRDWSPPHRASWKLRARWLDMNENCVDRAHFRFIHGTLTIPDIETSHEGHIFRTQAKMRMKGPGGSESDGMLCTNDYGPGFQIVTVTGLIDTIEMNTSTPIDEEYTEVSMVCTARTGGDERTEHLARKIAVDMERQFGNDIPIWENKASWERPVLCDGDGPVGAYRKWVHQFFDA